MSGARVESRTFAPAALHADVVHRYWATRWDLRDDTPHTVELLADPCVTVAFEAGRSRVVGVSTGLFQRQLEGAGLIRAVTLRAGAARALLRDAPIDRFTDRTVDLAGAFDCDVAELERAVLTPETDAAAMDQIETWLAARIRRPLEAQIALACQAVAIVRDDSQLTTVSQLARAVHLSPRAVQRLFRDFVGASPKWVIRRHRLQEAAVRLERGDHLSLASLAVELGYSDHAHLTRDFAAATGRSPSQFARDVWT